MAVNPHSFCLIQRHIKTSVNYQIQLIEDLKVEIRATVEKYTELRVKLRKNGSASSTDSQALERIKEIVQTLKQSLEVARNEIKVYSLAATELYLRSCENRIYRGLEDWLLHGGELSAFEAVVTGLEEVNCCNDGWYEDICWVFPWFHDFIQDFNRDICIILENGMAPELRDDAAMDQIAEETNNKTEKNDIVEKGNEETAEADTTSDAEEEEGNIWWGEDL